MATNVFYNGVELHNVVTRKWEQEVVYDESGTDRLYDKFSLEFEGILHSQWASGSSLRQTPAYIEADSGPGGHTDNVKRYKDVRRRLSQPRRSLRVEMNGKDILVAWPTGGLTPLDRRDVDNGPKPKNVAITHVASDKVFRVRFAIEVCLAECPTYAGGPPSWVLNNRWSVSEVMDEKFFITRTIRGKIRFGGPPEVTNTDFRALVVPTLEVGFRRASVEYEMSPTGLEANYQIVDRQVHTSAPFPAVRLSGTYSENTADGVNFISDVRVRLEGSPSSDKQLMLTRCLQITENRLGGELGEELQKTMILESASLIEHLGDSNTVESHFRVRRVIEDGDHQAYLGRLTADRFGQPLDLPELVALEGDYNPLVSESPPLYGYESQTGNTRDAVKWFLYQCFLQSACINNHAIVQGTMVPGEPAPGPDPPETPPIIERSPGDIKSPGHDDNVSEQAKTSLYTTSTMESVYEHDALRIQMPLAVAYPDDSIAAERDTCVITRLGQGIARRIIRIEAERAGSWPQLPKPVDTYQDGTLKGTLLSHKLRAHPPTLTADGETSVYRLSAETVYALNRPPRPDETLRVGVLPTHTFSQEANAFNAEEAYSEELGP